MLVRGLGDVNICLLLHALCFSGALPFVGSGVSSVRVTGCGNGTKNNTGLRRCGDTGI